MLDPSGAKKIWLKTGHKLSIRSNILAQSDRASSMIVSMCNNRAFPVLGYMAQLASPSSTLNNAENRVLQRLLHLLQHSFPPNQLFNLKSILKLIQLNSMQVVAAGADFRIAHKTALGWRPFCDLLSRACKQFRPYIQVIRGRRSKEWRDAPPHGR
jgi:hypothetical protein